MKRFSKWNEVGENGSNILRWYNYKNMCCNSLDIFHNSMNWGYGSDYRERKREVLRYGCDVRECLCEIERKQKGKNKLIHAYLHSASRMRKRAEGELLSSPLFFKLLRDRMLNLKELKRERQRCTDWVVAWVG